MSVLAIVLLIAVLAAVAAVGVLFALVFFAGRSAHRDQVRHTSRA